MSEKNYAFIDSQNLNLQIRKMGWKLDFIKFRRYLREKYHVTAAYIFIGYIKEYHDLYDYLRRSGYILIFKPVLKDKNGNVKGNVDADLVLETMIQYPNFDGALIVTSDGDFYSLVNYLRKHDKLTLVMSPNYKKCSILLKYSAKEKLLFMDNLRKKLEYIAKKHR